MIDHTGPAVPAVASDEVAALVRGPWTAVDVLAAFPSAVYLTGDDGGVVVVVAADGIVHPNAIVDTAVTAMAPFTGAAAHQHGWIGRGQVVLPRRHLRVTRWFDPVPRLRPATPGRLADRVALVRARVAATTPSVPDELATLQRALVAALARDDSDPAPIARRLLGRGPGLTPAGDDMLCGLLAATPALSGAVGDQVALAGVVARVQRLAAELVPVAREATTLISAALLGHASRGAVAAPFADTLHGLTGRGSLRVAIDRLLAVGATSGRDLCIGLLAAADLVLDAAAGRVRVTTPLIGSTTQ